jgi:choline dehydrogenase-like flavoprotein
VNFPAVYLLHGRGGSPNGSVMQLETELRGRGLKQNYFRPLMPHSDETVTPWHLVPADLAKHFNVRLTGEKGQAPRQETGVVASSRLGGRRS